jgi:hypothetical protein
MLLEDTCIAGVDLGKLFVGRFGFGWIFGRDGSCVYITITVGRAGRRRFSLTIFTTPTNGQIANFQNWGRDILVCRKMSGGKQPHKRPF